MRLRPTRPEELARSSLASRRRAVPMALAAHTTTSAGWWCTAPPPSTHSAQQSPSLQARNSSKLNLFLGGSGASGVAGLLLIDDLGETTLQG